MTGARDVDLRALVHDAVARHFGDAGGSARRESTQAPPLASPGIVTHASHGIYLTLINAGDACVIEPDVACTHCEYCRSHGH